MCGFARVTSFPARFIGIGSFLQLSTFPNINKMKLENIAEKIKYLEGDEESISERMGYWCAIRGAYSLLIAIPNIHTSGTNHPAPV